LCRPSGTRVVRRCFPGTNEPGCSLPPLHPGPPSAIDVSQNEGRSASTQAIIILRSFTATMAAMRPHSATICATLLCFLIMSATPAHATERGCKLPSGLRKEVLLKYPGSTVVNREDLTAYDEQLFERDHTKSCPGLVQVDFYGDRKPTCAIVLLRQSNKKADWFSRSIRVIGNSNSWIQRMRHLSLLSGARNRVSTRMFMVGRRLAPLGQPLFSADTNRGALSMRGLVGRLRRSGHPTDHVDWLEVIS